MLQYYCLYCITVKITFENYISKFHAPAQAPAAESTEMHMPALEEASHAGKLESDALEARTLFVFVEPQSKTKAPSKTKRCRDTHIHTFCDICHIGMSDKNPNVLHRGDPHFTPF